MSLLSVLSAAGVRLTAPRRRVLEYLQRQSEPKTAAQIFQGIGQGSDLASVYRTLELLERLGSVVREPRQSEAAYSLSSQHHHHIVCRNCERQACVPCDLHLPSPKGFSAVQHAVSLTGVCTMCARA